MWEERSDNVVVEEDGEVGLVIPSPEGFFTLKVSDSILDRGQRWNSEVRWDGQGMPNFSPERARTLFVAWGGESDDQSR